MGQDCCKSKKPSSVDMEFKQEKAELTKTPTPQTAGIISMDDDESRLGDLYESLEASF